MHGWQGSDFAFIRAHHRDQVLPVLWPLEHGYADTADESKLPEFLARLGKRDAHLQPGIGLERTWGRAEVESLDRRGALVGELRAAAAEVLGVLDEPPLPACAARRP